MALQKPEEDEGEEGRRRKGRRGGRGEEEEGKEEGEEGGGGGGGRGGGRRRKGKSSSEKGTTRVNQRRINNYHMRWLTDVTVRLLMVWSGSMIVASTLTISPPYSCALEPMGQY